MFLSPHSQHKYVGWQLVLSWKLDSASSDRPPILCQPNQYACKSTCLHYSLRNSADTWAGARRQLQKKYNQWQQNIKETLAAGECAHFFANCIVPWGVMLHLFSCVFPWQHIPCMGVRVCVCVCEPLHLWQIEEKSWDPFSTGHTTFWGKSQQFFIRININNFAGKLF